MTVLGYLLVGILVVLAGARVRRRCACGSQDDLQRQNGKIVCGTCRFNRVNL